MTYMQRLQDILRESPVRIWKHGELPMPDWVPPLMTTGVEANGTFVVRTEVGNARVHPGSIVVERLGKSWVKPSEDAAEFIENLNLTFDAGITNVGPGKTRQFGHPRESKNGSLQKVPKDKLHGRRWAPLTESQPSIEWIHVEKLSVDKSYQRSTDNDASRRLITSIAARFDWRLCTPLVVSRRPDDSLVIIDGQHRWMAASLRGDVPQLPCCVFRYESMAEEARMFIVANRARKPMNRLDDYFAAIAAGDEDALEIQEIVKDAGLKIARNISAPAWQPGEIAFTSAIANAIRRHGVAITSAVLTNMAVAFPNQKLVHGGAIFVALVRIMAKPPEAFDPDKLVSTLESKTISEWGVYVHKVTSGDARADVLYEAILKAYESLSNARQSLPL